MGKSGVATMLLLALAAVVVLVAVARSNAEVAAAWARLTGPPADTTVVTAPVMPPTNPRAMSAGDGARQVEQMQRDMEQMQDLSRSVGR
jgi:hypothetical protein